MIAQVPNAINYQAVYRDDLSTGVYKKSTVAVIISIKKGSPNGEGVFSETHSTTINENGLFTIQIGIVNPDDFALIDWAADTYYLGVNVNGTDFGTSQILSVPYAVLAQDVINKDDADADATNELQTLSINDHTLSLADGGEVTLPDNVDDADNDPTNELQTLSVISDTLILDRGGRVKMPSVKVQVSLIGDTLYFSDENWVIIPGISAPNYNISPETVTDYDGNEYKTVMIGGQIWMAENLRTTHYADGTALVDGTGMGDVDGNLTTKLYYYYEDNPDNSQIYGVLYSWMAVMNDELSSDGIPSNVRGVCPIGWHVPSDAEWKILENEIGLSETESNSGDIRGEVEGGKLKEEGTIHWQSPNTEATNSSGFTALPAGLRGENGSFVGLNSRTHFRTSTEYTADRAYARYLYYDSGGIGRSGSFDKEAGYSVRCVKD